MVDLACIQTKFGREFCEGLINSISWHGFYDERGENHMRRRYEEEYRKFRRPIKSIDTGQQK
ncbi:hypothetical protein [Thermoanaerobacterium sp. DL9XJH110]|uniref:hypothetical protein n=1 Tax=Thermoanaerobacterium sp. DL9XJH110 TaxID=3386643 RepID=UPI003BB7F8EE